MAERRARVRARVATSVVVLLLAGLLPAPTALASDPVTDARQDLSRRIGGAPDDFQLLGEMAVTAEPGMWAAKFLDVRTGAVLSSYRRADGTTGSVELLDEALASAQAALPVLDRKADAPLLAAVRARAAAEVLRVAVWLDVDVSTAEATVEQSHPEVEWLAGRPIPTSLDQARALRAELWKARQAVYAAAAEAVEAQVNALGGRVSYVSTSAPLVFVDMPSEGVAALAERPEVLSLGLEQGWRTFMSSAGVTVGANWTGGSGDQGNGVRVAVVEYANAANTGDLAGRVVKRYSTNGRIVTHIHPTWVAGAVASQSSTWRGVAPGTRIVSAGTGNSAPGLSTDRAVIAATDWAISPERRRRRHRQHQLRPGHRDWSSGGSTLLRLRRLGGQPAGRRVERQLLDLRKLERRVSRDRLQRAHGGRHQRPQYRRQRRRRPVVRIERSELRRPRRHGLESARRLQQAEPVRPGGQRANGERHDRRRDEHREPDRGRHRRPAHCAVTDPGDLARGDPRGPDGRGGSAHATARRRPEPRSRGRRHRIGPMVEPGPRQRRRTEAGCSAR